MWWGRFEMCFGTWCSSNRGAYFHINNLSTMQVKFSIVSCVFGGSYQIALLCDPCWKSTLKLLACTSRFSMKSMHGRLTQLTWQLKFFKFRVVHDRYWFSLFFQNRVMIHERSVHRSFKVKLAWTILVLKIHILVLCLSPSNHLLAWWNHKLLISYKFITYCYQCVICESVSSRIYPSVGTSNWCWLGGALTNRDLDHLSQRGWQQGIHLGSLLWA